MTSVRLRLWSEAEFASSREPWQALLAASSADPLFMSWDWQWRWWKHHWRLLSAQPRILAAYAEDDSLVGIVPLYAQRVRHRGLIGAWRLQLLGGSWRDGRPAFSEYLDFIVAAHAGPAFFDALAQWFRAEREWDDLVLPNVLPNSHAARFAREFLSSGALIRSVDPLVAHRLRLPASFEAYTAGLASGVRRRLLNQRRKIGQPELILAGPGEIAEDLRALRAFKAERWRRTHCPEFLDFHLEFAAAMAELGCLRLSRLVAGGQTLSVLYDIRAGGAEYYLESGFDANSATGLTPGYLHLGYAIESACADGLERFDLLGGHGRHRAYKRDLCPEEATLFCYQVVRAPLLRALYGVHGLLEQLKSGAAAGAAAGDPAIRRA
jgi:CelD/BcsL family acetyltransferase involved in cellulose biosynthesis